MSLSSDSYYRSLCQLPSLCPKSVTQDVVSLSVEADHVEDRSEVKKEKYCLMNGLHAG